MKISLLSLLLILVISSSAQTNKKQALQKEYNNLLSEIKGLQKTINDRKKARTISLHEIELINNKITKRERLIANIQVQMTGIESELIERQSEVANLDQEISKLKEEYRKLVIWLNKNHNSTNKLAFVLESRNFNEAYQRIRYIKKYGDYRARQSIVLKNQVERILTRINALNQVKKEKSNLLEANKYQKIELITEKKNRDDVVNQLSSELQTLKKQVDEKNRLAVSINTKIKKIIEDEIRIQRQQQMSAIRERKKREAAKRNQTIKEADITYTSEDFEKSPEGILSSSFLSSKGSMPWPVNSGNITSHFGRQPHPADQSIFIENNGIDIKAPNGAEVKTIYKGTVARVFNMPGYNTCVMIRHGDYFTVYSYLSSSNVKTGDEVDAKEIIGRCGLSDQHGYALVNLQIWHYQNKQNPELWLRGR